MSKMNNENDAGKRLSMRNAKQTLATRSAGFVVVLVLLLTLLTAYTLAQVRDLSQESEEPGNLTIPLKEIVTEVKHHQLEQHLALDRIFRISFREDGNEGGDVEYEKFKQMKEDIILFEEHGRQAEEKIMAGRTIIESAQAEAGNSAEEYEHLNNLLLSLQSEHHEFEEGARTLITQLIYDGAQESHAQFEIVEAEAEDVDHDVEELLVGLDSSTDQMEKEGEENDSTNIKVTGALIIAEAAVATIFGAVVALFSSRQVTRSPANREWTTPSAEEKQVLLKEIHHRVKNNLQIISSLLYLQSEYIDDEQSQDVLTESQNRVKSMALVHDQVYQSSDLSRISFSDYIQKLATYLLRKYNINQNAITLKINVDDIYLSADTAIPCGLIINELILNSLKHAFPVNRAGEINIEFHAIGNGKFSLRFRDNGVDFSKVLDGKTEEPLGVKLIYMLTRQLDGAIEVDGSDGNVFMIIFPRDGSLNMGS